MPDLRPEISLRGHRVLVVEDEFFIADDLAQRLSAHGAVLVGPVPTLEIALALVNSADRIDAAVVDINLKGEVAFPLADTLQARGVPFVFATGYDTSAIPARYQHIPCWVKPYRLEELIHALPALIHRS